MAIELCCGAAVFTAALMWAQVPCAKPWDTKYGARFNTLTEGHLLFTAVKVGVLAAAFLGIPCVFWVYTRTFR